MVWYNECLVSAKKYFFWKKRRTGCATANLRWWACRLVCVTVLWRVCFETAAMVDAIDTPTGLPWRHAPQSNGGSRCYELNLNRNKLNNLSLVKVLFVCVSSMINWNCVDREMTTNIFDNLKKMEFSTALSIEPQKNRMPVCRHWRTTIWDCNSRILSKFDVCDTIIRPSSQSSTYAQ